MKFTQKEIEKRMMMSIIMLNTYLGKQDNFDKLCNRSCYEITKQKDAVFAVAKNKEYVAAWKPKEDIITIFYKIPATEENPGFKYEQFDVTQIYGMFNLEFKDLQLF